MILNLNDYRRQVPVIKVWLGNKPDWKFDEEVGLLALATSVHVVAVSCYIGELYGFTENVVSKIERDSKFYDIELIKNIVLPNGETVDFEPKEIKYVAR